MATRAKYVTIGADKIDAELVALQGAGKTIVSVVKVTSGSFLIIYTE